MIGRCTSRKAPTPISQISTRDDERDRGIGPHGAEPRPPAGAHQADRQPVLHEEQIGRADAEHHRRMAIEPVAQPAPARQRQIFAHRQRVDVAHAAALEIAGGGVMHGMRAPPEIVGRQREHAERAADPVIGEAMAEERAVPAIVLDHEQAHQEAGGRNGEQQGQPPEAEMNRTATSAPRAPASGPKVMPSSTMLRGRLGSR